VPAGFWRPFHKWQKPHSDDWAAQFDQDTTEADIQLHRWYEPRQMAIIRRRVAG
jgi:hypothetical protein